MNLLYLIIGLVMIIIGAKYLVDGSTALANRMRMSQFLIGLTIVGMGTSMPELVVSLIGSLQGKGDVAIGNVTGSNTANILLILGISALIRPIPISRSTLRFDMPFNILTAVLLLLFTFGFTFLRPDAAGTVTRVEGFILLALFVSFMVYSFRTGKADGITDAIDYAATFRGAEAVDHVEDAEAIAAAEGVKKPMLAWLMAIMIIGGLGLLIFGGRLFVSGGTALAQQIGVSDAVISITILAIGTSLPELATSMVAAIKGNTQLALGNILGSNIFNTCLILGVSSLARPLGTGTIVPMDIYISIVAALVLFLTTFFFRKKKLDRYEGVLFIVLYAAKIDNILFHTGFCRQ